MKILITGATGMVGKAVLIEALAQTDIKEIVLINRTPMPADFSNEKITEILHQDFSDFSSLAPYLESIDACFYCMGTSSFGLSEQEYTVLTYDFAFAFAQTLLANSPQCVCQYVSGAYTDSSEQGKVMWARVKGKTENMFLNAGFKDAYALRPNAIYPRKGVKSKTMLYRLAYAFLIPVAPLVKLFSPIIDSDELARIMLSLAKQPFGKKHIEIADFAQLSARII